ncbi:MAG: phosphoribosylamine--glycine ligase [Candidatus Thermoplasmatota archaeon]|nr:phosphoribosylamine--glycine ligase [Candidatus Thermoplasmatota archaeon]
MSDAVVLIVGGGGREHALALGLIESASVGSVHVAPGNAGTEMIATNHAVAASDIDGLLHLAKRINANLVVVGPEGPLVSGLSDRLREAGVPSFGPHAEGARLEGSKEYAKQVMLDLGVPTAAVIRIDSHDAVDVALDTFSSPWVVKRDVLAGGKGVTVTEDRDLAHSTISDAIDTDGFVLLEEFMAGEEASMLVLMDESGYVCLPASQDHKRVGEGDTGPNTGGMGAYAPAPVVTEAVKARVIEQIVEPMHVHLSTQEVPYRGCLYVGLMIDADGLPRVVEFNVRFGDPETQVTVPLIATDLNHLLGACANGSLADIDVKFHNAATMTVVLASEGYPQSAKTGRILVGSEGHIEEGDIRGFIHHAGTRLEGDKIVSSGGRVCSATGIAPNLTEAASTAYRLMDGLDLPGSHHRRDIGYRAL